MVSKADGEVPASCLGPAPVGDPVGRMADILELRDLFHYLIGFGTHLCYQSGS